MSRVLLTGATGVLGQELLVQFRAAGHQVIGASRSPPSDDEFDWVELDLASGRGIREAVEDIDIIVHAASDARGDTYTVDVQGTNRLLEAADQVDVQNFVYVSIVGIDEIPYSYYKHKLEAERSIEGSSVPSTILRITQFYPFVAFLLGLVRKLPVWPLPTNFKLQPIDPTDAAQVLVEHTKLDASGRIPDIGGPEVLSAREIAEEYRESIGLRRPIIRFPIPGEVASAFRAGNAICPERDIGTKPWRDWLDEHKGIPGAGVY